MLATTADSDEPAARRYRSAVHVYPQNVSCMASVTLDGTEPIRRPLARNNERRVLFEPGDFARPQSSTTFSLRTPGSLPAATGEACLPRPCGDRGT